MKEYRITEEQIKHLATLGYARECVKEWFPQAFEGQWEEVPLGQFAIFETSNGRAEGHYLEDVGIWSHPLPFSIIKNGGSFSKDNYKIEDGKIWRRKP